MASRLVLITHSYPLGGITETPFITPEIGALASRFDEVTILPLNDEAGGSALPELPGNVKVDRSLLGAPGRKDKLGLLFHPAVWTHLPGDIPYMRSPRHLRHAIATSIYTIFYRKKLQKWAAENRIDVNNTLFYTFWFNFATTALSGIAGARIVTRAHGNDLYDFRPLFISHTWRRHDLAGIRGCFVVADMGAKYLRSNYLEFGDKIGTRRLGTPDPGIRNPETGSKNLTFLSCSRLDPVKRVDNQLRLVKEWARRNSEREITWICIGDGPDLPKVEAVAASLPENLRVEMTGALPNSLVREIMAARHVDLLLLLSSSEGCPIVVSEALSYGIPAVGTDVGGMREIVTPESGLLLSADPDADEFCRAIDSVIPRLAPLRDSARSLWERSFDSKTLRENFADELLAICNGNQKPTK